MGLRREKEARAEIEYMATDKKQIETQTEIGTWRKSRSLRLARKLPKKTNGFAAIPTIYRNIQFRSRLEARWAAFFDLLCWVWEYEPRDMPGWIPDFVITGGLGEAQGLHSEILVEVKPVLAFPTSVAHKIESALSGRPDDGILREPLIVGEHPLWMADWVLLGWLGDDCGPAGGYVWGGAVMGVWNGELPPGPYGKHVVGFCHEEMGYCDRISGRYDGSTHEDGIAVDEIRDYWVEAGNRVQYKSPGRENCERSLREEEDHG